MPAPSNLTKGAVAAAVAAAVVGLYIGTRTPDVAVNRRRSGIAWSADAGARPGAKCTTQMALVSPEALALAGLDGGGRERYVWTRTCANVTDGGQEETLLAGMEAIAHGQEEEDYDGGPQITVIMDGEPELSCACSTGADCERRIADGGWVSATGWGNTLAEGQWRGAGCRTKSCIELAGRASSWPDECPP